MTKHLAATHPSDFNDKSRNIGHTMVDDQFYYGLCRIASRIGLLVGLTAPNTHCSLRMPSGCVLQVVRHAEPRA